MERDRRLAKPARSGLVVPMPERGGVPLPAEGLEVPVSSYWLRRVADGDVVFVEPAAAADRARARKE